MTTSELRELVRRRAKNRCEYCLLSQGDSPARHDIEHIIAKQHGGLLEVGNLALACLRCNYQNGTNLSGIDPRTRDFAGLPIEGITAIGRTTAALLSFNDARRLELRRQILATGSPLAL